MASLLSPYVPVFLLLQLNDRLSLGQHRLWKRMAVKWTRVKPGQRALDVCCGSGDLAILLADAVGPAGRVTGLDFAADMLQVGVCYSESLNPIGS
jgi:demethylmenaquinone methyltransferase/2-methoxy-6-polyprenyl-1,4-benzoquinol methylase